jgi:hypothetical protein
MLKVNGRHIIKGIRTSAWSGEAREVELQYLAKVGALYKLWFEIEPGVTGYESFEISPESFEQISREGWRACAGTEKRWDSLFIPAEQMTIALRDIAELITSR